MNSSHVHRRNPPQDEYVSTYNPNRVRSISASLGDSSSSTALIQQRMRNISLGSRSFSEEDDAKNNNAMVESNDKDEKRKRLEEFQGKVRDLYQVELSVRPQVHRNLEAYPMRRRNRGVIFIVNVITYINDTHPKRNGAETDKDNLVSLFRQLGFTVFYYEDLTREVWFRPENHVGM